MTDDLLRGLNEEQRAAVTAPDGAVMVLAGPGSGKTRVLTHRIAYLIEERDIRPWRIMAVTFTNRAAREMRERTEALLEEGNTQGLTIGTFHATCARILRREVDEHLPGYTREFVIFDRDDQTAAVKQAMADLNIDDKKFNPNNIRNGIGQAKNAHVTADEYQSNNYIGEIVGRVYRRYQEILVVNNAMDFDDLLMNTVALFDRAPLVAAKYRDRYQHVLIDEFQDTNLTQYGIIRRLAGDNVFIVGDVDQSIYKWRGADVRNLQRFREDFPDATQILLEQNYRSTQTILDAAMHVIRQNQNRVHKQLFTERGAGEQIMVREAYNGREEADQIVTTIQNLRLEGYTPGDCAIMYRTNAQSRSLEEAFLQAGIPYRLVGATRFYNRREIKDVVAYLRTIHNPADQFSLNRIVNTPRRGIGSKTWESLMAWADRHGWQPTEALLELAGDDEIQHPFSTRAYNQLRPFGDLLRTWVELSDSVPVVDLLDHILEHTDYRSHLDDGTEEGEERWGNVLEFRSVALLAGEMPLSEFLEEVALVSDVDNLELEAEAVTLLTLHSAKGLEFPVVFIAGVEDGILPHSRSTGSDDPEDMAEERRLFYVGMTRAKDRLYLTHVFQRMVWGRTDTAVPSRFLKDLPGELTVGGSAGSRRTKSKKRAGSWGGEYASSRSKWSPSKETDRHRPKSTRRTKHIPDKVLPEPNKSDKKNRPFAQPAPDAPRFSKGDKVRHGKFGEGVVLDSKVTGTDEEVRVLFAGKWGEKKLAAGIAKLEKVS